MNKTKYFMKRFFKIISKNAEAILWFLGLIYLATINPYSSDHLTLCGFKLLGFDNCPGCGLGRSISLIFRGDIHSSFDMHPLGFFALTLILWRIFNLIYKFLKEQSTLEVEHGKRITTTT